VNRDEALRFHLKAAYEDLSRPGTSVRLPPPAKASPATLFPKPGAPEGHFHLGAEVFFQRSSGTKFRFPSGTLDLGPGECLLVPPRTYHAETIVADGHPFLNIVLYADKTNLSCHLADQGTGGVPQVAYPEHREGPVFGQIASWMEDAARVSRDISNSTRIVTDLIRSVLGMAILLLDLPAQGQEEPLPVVRCRRMIHEDLGNSSLSVASLAQRLGCSADYLSHLFRTARGEKLTTYIEELRMLRAAELLTETGLSCKEAAWASGYSNQSYFIRCFRKRWGASPGSYRQSKG